MADNIYMNAEDIPAPAPPPKMKRGRQQPPPQIIYADSVNIPRPPGANLPKRQEYATPTFAGQKSDDVVYADVMHNKRKGGNVNSDADQILYADIEVISKGVANTRVAPQKSAADLLDEDADRVLYADIQDIHAEERARKERLERERLDKERKDRERKERLEREAAAIAKAKSTPSLPERAYVQKGKATSSKSDSSVCAHAKWYNAPPGDKSVRVVLELYPPNLKMSREDTGSLIHQWTTNTLRGFGQKGRTFAFEAGRRSSTGEGFFKFMIDDDTDFQTALKLAAAKK